MKKLLALTLAFALIPLMALAGCPVCTVTIGTVMIGARWLGVDEIYIGLWTGGLVLSIMFWLWTIMKKRDVNGLWFLFPPALALWVLWVIYFLMVTLFPSDECVFGIGMHPYVTGVLIGLPTFFGAFMAYLKYKKKHGKAMFPGQKIVWPVGALIIMTAVLALVLSLSNPTYMYKPCPESLQITQTN